MIKIRMLTCYAGPTGTANPGEIRNVSAEEAAVLVPEFAERIEPEATATVEPEEAAGNTDLTAIDGIGPATMGQLNEMGIKTLVDLAEASPQQVAAVRGVSEEQAERLIADAIGMVG